MYLLKPTSYAYVRVHTRVRDDVAGSQKRADRIYAFNVANIFFNALSTRYLLSCMCFSSFSSFFFFVFLFAYTRATVTSSPQRHTLPEASERNDVLFSKKLYVCARVSLSVSQCLPWIVHLYRGDGW